MKRFFAILLALIFLLCGCTAVSPAKTFTLGEFEAMVSTQLDSFEISGTLKYVSQTDIIFTVIMPKELAGTVIKLQNDDMTASLDGIEIPIGSTALLTGNKNVFENLFKALSSLANASYEIPNAGNEAVNGDYSFGKFSAKLDCENEKLTEISTDSFTYKFSY